MITIRFPQGIKKEGRVDWGVERKPFRLGVPLSAYIPENLKSLPVNRIICSGRMIPEKPPHDFVPTDPKVFDALFPRDEDEITIIPAIQEPASGSILLSIAIDLAIAAAMTGLSILVNKLLAPHPQKTSLPNSPPTTQGWNGLQNTYGPGNPIPVIFGETRCPVEVLYWIVRQEYVKKNGKKIDLSKTKSWAMFGGSFGRKVHAISNVMINGNPYTNYGDDVEVFTRLGAIGQSAVPGFNEQGVTYEVDTEITDGGPFTYTTTGTNLTALELLFSAPQGIAQIDGNGNIRAYKVKYTVRYKKHSLSVPPGSWTDLGEHEASANTTNICRWNKRIDELDEDRYDVELQRTSAIGTSKFGQLFLHSVTEFTETEALAYEGLSTVWIKALAAEGLSDQPFTVTADIQGIECPIWDRDTGLWTTNVYYTDNPAAHCREIMANDEVIKCNGVDLPPWGFGPWCGAGKIDDDSWGAFYEYCAEANLLTWSEKFDDDDWVKTDMTVTPDAGTAPNDPDDLTFCQTLTATGANATILQAYSGASAERTFSVYLKRKTGTGNIQITQDGGSSWETVTITNTDFTRVDMTDAVSNPSVGIRIVASGDEIYAFGAMLNIGDAPFSYLASDAVGGIPRHSNNLVWNSRKTMDGILDDILFASRGKKSRFRGKWRVSPRRLSDPSQKFNSGNLIACQMERGKEIRDYNALQVTYISKDQNYTPTSFQADLGISPLKVKNISVYGINNAREAYRLARFLLNLAYYTIERPKLKASIDAILCMPGDTIRFSDAAAGIGIYDGRVKYDSTVLDTVRVEQQLTAEAGKTYQVVIRYSGGANPDLIETRDVATVSGDIVTVVPNFTQLPKRGDLITFGETHLVTKTYWVDDWASADEEVIDLVCSEENSLIYNDWGTPPVEEAASYPYADVPPNQIQTMNVTEETYMSQDGQWTTNLRLFWQMPAADPDKGFYRSANLYYSIPDLIEYLGTFESGETWSGGAADTTWPEFREREGTRSRKIAPTTDGNWIQSERTDCSPFDLSGSADFVCSVWCYINEILKAYNGNCVGIVLKTDESNYFLKEFNRNSLDSGWQLLIATKAELEAGQIGSPDWASVIPVVEFRRGKSGGYACFDTFRCVGSPSWIFLDSAPGTDYYWPNAQQGTFFLFKAEAVSGLGAVNTVNPPYAGILTMGKTDYPTDVVFDDVNSNFDGEYPVIEWSEITDADLQGVELRYGASWAEGTKIDLFSKKTTKFKWIKYKAEYGSSGGRVVTVWGKALDNYGNYSLAEDSITLINPAEDMSGITITVKSVRHGTKKNYTIGWASYSLPPDHDHCDVYGSAEATCTITDANKLIPGVKGKSASIIGLPAGIVYDWRVVGADVFGDGTPTN
jgi:hypothetical protein